jgi:hypothetical protein
MTILGNTVALSDPPYWHRAVITKIWAEKLVQIFLVDYGYSLDVEYQNLTHLPNRFCTWDAQVK